MKPEGQSRSPRQHLTCNETPTAKTLDTPSGENSTVEARTCKAETSSSLDCLDADTTNASSVLEAVSSMKLANAEGSDTSSLASSALSEYTVASHEPCPNAIRRSMRNLRDHLRDSTVSTSIEQFRHRCAEHMFRKQGPRAIERAGMPDEEGVSAANSKSGRRESKFTEELGDDGTESTAALLEESEKATWRFFGLERKAG